MRVVLLAVAIVFAGCGDSGEPDASDAGDVEEIVEEAAEDVPQSAPGALHSTIQEAEDVGNVLQESADRKDAAVDEASEQ